MNPRSRGSSSDRGARPAGPLYVPGVRAVEALFEHSPKRLRALLYAGDSTGARGRLIEHAKRQHLPLYAVSADQLDELTEGANHQGVAAETTPAPLVDWSALLNVPRALVLAVDEVTDPRNLGAMIRSAEALGASGVLLTRHRCAHLGPTVTKTSAGASELLPVSEETNLVSALKMAREAGFQCIGADLEGEHPANIDWTAPTVLIIGAEGRGLRRLTKTVCDRFVTIPLVGKTASLNASVAASVLLYQASIARSNTTEKPCQPQGSDSWRQPTKKRFGG